MSLIWSRFLLLLRLLRVYQWSKNALVLMPLVFAQELGDITAVLRSIGATAAFCLAASATYIFNDLRDRTQDGTHPKKRQRPLPAGEISPAAAIVICMVLLASAAVITYPIGAPFALALAVYLLLTVGYTLVLKRIFIVDVIVVALGFVTRAIAGAVAIHVEFSHWLIVCTLFLALFLALGKRRGEIALLEHDAANHRDVLDHYTIGFIDQLLIIVAGGALITFTIYTCSPEVMARLGTDKLYMTLPFVVYGLSRYLWLIQRNETGDPSQVLVKDVPICITVLLWALTCVALIYT